MTRRATSSRWRGVGAGLTSSALLSSLIFAPSASAQPPAPPTMRTPPVPLTPPGSPSPTTAPLSPPSATPTTPQPDDGTVLYLYGAGDDSFEDMVRRDIAEGTSGETARTVLEDMLTRAQSGADTGIDVGDGPLTPPSEQATRLERLMQSLDANPPTPETVPPFDPIPEPTLVPAEPTAMAADYEAGLQQDYQRGYPVNSNRSWLLRLKLVGEVCVYGFCEDQTLGQTWTITPQQGSDQFTYASLYAWPNGAAPLFTNIRMTASAYCNSNGDLYACGANQVRLSNGNSSDTFFISHPYDGGGKHFDYVTLSVTQPDGRTLSDRAATGLCTMGSGETKYCQF